MIWCIVPDKAKLIFQGHSFVCYFIQYGAPLRKSEKIKLSLFVWLVWVIALQKHLVELLQAILLAKLMQVVAVLGLISFCFRLFLGFGSLIARLQKGEKLFHAWRRLIILKAQRIESFLVGKFTEQIDVGFSNPENENPAHDIDNVDHASIVERQNAYDFAEYIAAQPAFFLDKPRDTEGQQYYSE